MKINQAGIDLLKRFEGLRLEAYKDAIGILTIGYGHTSMAGSPKVVSGLRISKDEAEKILKKDLGKYEAAVEKELGASISTITDNQFAALASLCYNIGPGNLAKASCIREIKRGNFEKAANRLLLWNKAGGKVLRGLTRRRKAERELFLK